MPTGTSRLDAYLRSLPEALDSFPDYRAKASLVRTALAQRPLPENTIRSLPDRLADLASAPPPISSWIGEVEYNAISLAIADAHGWDEVEFGSFWFDVTRSLVGTKIYRRLIGYVTPSIVLRSGALRWSAFHRGVELHTQRSPEGLTLELTAPDGLLPPICGLGYAKVFEAIIEGSSREARVTLEESEGGRFVYLVRDT